MKIKRPLAPGFINNLDEYLLLNKPDTWSARAHLVLYYGLLFMAALTAICFVMPNDPREESIVFIWCVLVGLLSLIGFILWLIYLLRFNVFKRYGVVSAGDRVKTFLLYFLSIGIMVAAVYIPLIVETARANNAYTETEITKDINDMNVAICRLCYDSLPHKWKKQSYIVRDSVPGSTRYSDDEVNMDTIAEVVATAAENVVSPKENGISIIDTAELNRKLRYADSSQKINDSTYYLYECPQYKFVYSNRAWVDSGAEFKSITLFDKVIRNYIVPGKEEKKKITDSLVRLVKKYTADTSDKWSYMYDGYSMNTNYEAAIKSTYHLYGVTRSIMNIQEKKYRWNDRGLTGALKSFYYITLILTLLVYVFRHTTVRTFFLTLLSSILLLVLTSLFSAFFNIGSTTGWIIFISYYALFFLLSLMAINNNKRKLVTGIALNLTVSVTAFIPMVVVSLYYSILRQQSDYKDLYTEEFHEHQRLHFLYAEIIGAVLLLVLVETLFKFLYRKWYAAPEQ